MADIPRDWPFLTALKNASKKNEIVEFSRYGQLATVDAEGFPCCRTVKIRGLLADCGVVIGADARSPKVDELKRNPNAELCWYFPISHEQFRLRGTVSIIGADGTDGKMLAHRASVWKQMKSTSRALYEQPAPSSLKQEAKLGDLDKYKPQPLDENHPSPNFVLIMLHPAKCDHLMLPQIVSDDTKPQHRESLLQPARRQKRWQHTWDTTKKSWLSRELNP